MDRLKRLFKLLKHVANEVEVELGSVLSADGVVATDDVTNHAPAEERSADELQARETATERGLAYADAREILPHLDRAICGRLSHEFREKHRVLPFALDDLVLNVATDEPGRAARRLRREYGVEEISYVVVTPTTFRRLQWAADLDVDGAETVLSAVGGDDGVDDLLEHDVTHQAESVALAETLLVEALSDRASDIHLENGLSSVRVRIRVDGELRDLTRYAVSKKRLQTIVRVFKVKAGMDISEQRLAQGGQFRSVIGGQRFFVRAQAQPTVDGENLIMRLLPQSAPLQSIDKLGFSPEVGRRYERILASPGGLVLVVGPTGSGKTTTLYAGLRLLARDGTRKVISIEDPVEYDCEGIQQVKVANELGFGFADAMRSFVRQDPDVILLGEVRDEESAREAIRASQTGHLVLTTLHCNDAVDAVQRLLDLGMLPNSIASELLAVFAQRLVKRICDACREPVEPDPAVAAEVFPDGVPDGFRTYRGRGCTACGDQGYHGRTAVVEYLPMNPQIRSAISAGSTLENLRSVVRDGGIASLRDRALEYVDQGVIAFESLPRFIPVDRLKPPPQT